MSAWSISSFGRSPRTPQQAWEFPLGFAHEGVVVAPVDARVGVCGGHWGLFGSNQTISLLKVKETMVVRIWYKWSHNLSQLIKKYVHAILNLTNNTTKPKLQVNIIKLSSIFGAFVTHKCTVYVASVTVAKATFINHNVLV